ncbi:MAG: type I DNA topoisomerase [Candidatus Liptonbacteria bacterium]|nr:type I DNA topoisomerase [Candidatus Liptonbacteria bacterium]
MKLIIVESPTKAKTISNFVGSTYKVESSFGHVRDLPKAKLGIDLENGFEPKYVIPKKAEKRVNALRKMVGEAKELILATDEDREGEAIAWHLEEILKESGSNFPPLKRIVFHEITERAIEEALKNPRSLDLSLVNAQQARRILDRLVGYKLSPFLWKKIRYGLSAGRVQSVALRIVIDREEEIKKFNSETYYTLHAELKSLKNARSVIHAELYKQGDEIIPKLGTKTKEEAEKILRDLEKSSYRILKIEKKEGQKNPMPPFITSTLEQSASRLLGFSSKKTMFMAQRLYENGYITYMRTDSLNISGEALRGATEWINKNLGSKYLLTKPRIFKTKSRLAQEAHEAIRPTKVEIEPKNLRLEKTLQKLYDLIWRRFMASQLPPAIFEATRVEVEAKSLKSSRVHLLKASGNLLRFDGFLKLWPMKFEEREIPPLEEKEDLKLIKAKAEEHHTEPPPRYNEASLIKTLENYGIGRPSTYAPIISVIQERGYVEKNQGKFFPTDIGTLVNKVMTENFPEVVDVQFTAKMEEDLDEIAKGDKEWHGVIRKFYNPFSKNLEEKYQEVSKKELTEEKTDIVCELCGKPMIVKFGRFGKFLSCSGYPDCKNKKTLKEPPKSIGLICPKCKEGEIIERVVRKNGRARGKIFWGCNRYPACDYASWVNPLKEKG